MKQTNTNRTESQYSTDLRESTVIGSVLAGLALGALLVVSSYPQLTLGVLIGLGIVPLFGRAKRTIGAYRDRLMSSRRTGGTSDGRVPRTTHR